MIRMLERFFCGVLFIEIVTAARRNSDSRHLAAISFLADQKLIELLPATNVSGRTTDACETAIEPNITKYIVSGSKGATPTGRASSAVELPGASPLPQDLQTEVPSPGKNKQNGSDPHTDPSAVIGGMRDLGLFDYLGQYDSKCGAPGESKLIVRPSGETAMSSWICPGKNFKWHNDRLRVLPNITCNVQKFSPGPGRCPEQCAFEAPSSQWCYFSCVTADECGTTDSEDKNPSSIPDVKQGICRKCKVNGCEKCLPKQDRCEICNEGHSLDENTGQCIPPSGPGDFIVKFLIAVASLIFLIFPLWYISLRCRPKINEEVLAAAHQTRQRMKVGPNDREYDTYPLLTNVHRVPIAGVGLLLQFDWQLAVLTWIVFVLASWSIFGHFVDPELLELGTRDLGHSPQRICMMLFLGAEHHLALSDEHCMYTGMIWIVSTVMVFLFSWRQRCRFVELDGQTATMMDYSVLVEGFPIDKGDADLETEYKLFFEKECPDIHIVGISMCWNFHEKRNEVDAAIRRMVEEREVEHANEIGDGTLVPLPDEDAPLPAKVCQLPDKVLLGGSFRGCPQEEISDEEYIQNVKTLLCSFETSGAAVVVLSSERSRNKIKEAISSRGFPRFRGTHQLIAHESTHEPENFLWHNFGTEMSILIRRACIGVIMLGIAILIWTYGFYQPYAHYMLKNFAVFGQAPSLSCSFTISCLVIVGNAIMYAICSAIAGSLTFRYRVNREVFYCVAYFFACLVNGILDVGTVLQSSYLEMVHQRVRAEDGRELSKIPNFMEFLRTFPMQHALGTHLYEYSWPGYFIYPFLVEPIFMVALPLHLGKLVARSLPLHQDEAEDLLQPLCLDLSRYVDILINISLASLSFWTASGFVSPTFIGLLAGNVFIYLYDRLRTLRFSRRVNFASYRMESVTQRLLAVPCAVLASACAKDLNLSMPMSIVFFCGHIVVHIALLRFLPSFRKDRTEKSILGEVSAGENIETQVTFEECAKTVPGSWFSLNPVHCLRSKYFHGHSPPCHHSVVGKEHLLQVNQSIGCHYVAATAHTKDLDEEIMAGMEADLKDSVSEIASAIGQTFSGDRHAGLHQSSQGISGLFFLREEASKDHKGASSSAA